MASQGIQERVDQTTESVRDATRPREPSRPSVSFSVGEALSMASRMIAIENLGAIALALFYRDLDPEQKLDRVEFVQLGRRPAERDG